MDPRYKSPEANVLHLQNETDDFRDLTRHTTILVWMLRVGALCAVLAVCSNWLQWEMLLHHFTVQEAHANDLRERAVIVSAMAVTLACFIVFGRWIVVAHRNLPALGARYVDISPGAAVGWFFVPIANLWKPYQAMRILWNASHDSERSQHAAGHWILVVWWGLWLISGVVGGFLFPASLHVTTIPQLLDATRAVMVNSLIDIPQYVIAWVLVRKIWDAQAAQRGRQIGGERAMNLQELTTPA